MLRAPQRTIILMSSVRIAVTVICILLGVGMGYWISQSRSAQDVQTAMLYPTPQELPEFSLVDTDGAAVDATSFRDHWSLVFFGFTNCPDVCPTTLQILSTARRTLKEDGVDPLPRIVLVSVDPERDTVDRLSAYVSGFGDGIVGLTGSLAAVETLTQGLNIFFQKVDLDNGGYTVDHSSVIMVVNPSGKLIGLFSAPHTVDALVQDYEALIGQ